MGSIISLGRLEAVPLRQAWPNEASNFTPWLAEEANLAFLGETLGLQLELESVEKPVGPFSADILAKEVGTERWILIENQIEPTDHRHLGQLLTYAAGLDAHIIVWIAESFREEHRAAIDFLNRATTEEFAFFGIQVELYRIGDSAMAPRFSVVAKPNGWSRRVQATKQQLSDAPLTEVQKLNREYWTALIAAAEDRFPALAARSPYKESWQTGERLRTVRGMFAAVANAAFTWDGRLRVEIYISDVLAKRVFHELYRQKSEIEEAFGAALAWEELPQGRDSRIAYYMPNTERRENRERWPVQHEWLLTYWPKLAATMKVFLASIDLESLQNVDVDASSNAEMA